MYDWTTALSSHQDSGVYWVGECFDETALREAAAVYDLDYNRVDLGEVRDKTGLLTAIADALQFPAYFGMNWDALGDCLTDMSWKPASGYVLFLAGFQSLPEKLDTDGQVAAHVLHAAAAFWKQKGVPFFVVLSI